MRLRLLLLILLLAAAGCRGSGQPERDRKQAPGGMPGAGPGLQVAGAAGPATTARTIAVALHPVPKQAQGAIAFIGFQSDQMDGEWSRLGVPPSHHAVSDPMPLSASFDLTIELVDGLTYLAILDLDDDGRPGAGELTSLPVPLPEGSEPVPFRIDRPYIPPDRVSGTVAAAPVAPGLPSPDEATGRTLRVDTTIKPPFLKEGRILVVGLPASGDRPFRGPLEVEPDFFWVSEPLQLDWPVSVQARFPEDGHDLLVVLDLDGAGAPSLGDLVTEPMLGFELPSGDAPIEVLLTGPLTDEPDDE